MERGPFDHERNATRWRIAREPFGNSHWESIQCLIPGRVNDFTIFGFGYGDFNSNYAAYQKTQGQGDPTYEMVSEFGYRVNFTRFFYVQPDIKYIINPGGTGTISNALVLGAQIGITF
ncbi:MAG: hypothetical protein A3F67_01215 [Verrucomicrobia bacterium RIFCSPHIGHO2_12_FULL_41_10]|nr:MAG: hypothetical protein A3F67_01215 [Verrucomicrobia bacterium RIFCSPHIGHO2_12_FULL_41_10]